MGGEGKHGAEPTPVPGTPIGDRFEVVGLLGSGGMAEVFRVRDRQSGRMLALKVLRTEVATQPEAVERLHREAAVLRSLAHPAIVAIESSGKLDDGRVFLAMELLEGRTLRADMRAGPMGPERLAPILRAVASGLGAAHRRGVLHRDLKPDNIFLCTGGDADGDRVKILDFGVSKVLGDGRITQTGQIVGTPRYMAPEQLTAERDIDARADVYALGVILYEALAGQPPFPTNDPAQLIVAVLEGRPVPLSALRTDLPPGLAAVVERAMSRDREARFATAEALARAFAEHARGEGGVAARPGMRTDALGSMEAPTGDGADHEPSGPLPAGTYSALAAGTDVPAAPEARGMPSSSAPPPGSRDLATPGTGTAPEPPASPASAPQSDPPPPPLARWPWLVGGAVAGVVTALLLLWATGAFGLFDAPPPIERPPAANAVTGGGTAEAETAPEPVAYDGGAQRTAESAPAPPEPAPPAQRTAAPQVTPPSRPRARRRPARTSGSSRGTSAARAPTAAPSLPPPLPPVPAPPAPAARTPSALLHQARAALGRQAYDECIDRVDAALSAGAPAPALRILGDCRLRSGDRTGALAAYRRFCRLVPDHPAIGEVRALVESMGASCP